MFVCLLLASPLRAQDLKTGTVEFLGTKYPAYIKEVDASVEHTDRAIKEIMDARNAKSKNYKGFNIYRNITLPASGSHERQDLFIHTEAVGKKTNNRTKISLIITRPGAIQEDKLTKEEREKMEPVVLAAGGAAIFAELTPAVENQVYLQSILDQEGLVKKAEKKLEDLRADSVKLEKQLLKIQTDKENNKVAVETQVAELEAAKAELLRRKTIKPKN